MPRIRMMSRSENFLQTSHYASLWPLASSNKPCTSPSILIHPFFTFFPPLGHFRFFDPVFFAFLSDFSIGPFPAPFFAAAFFMWRVWLGCSICVVNYEKAKSHSSLLFLLLLFLLFSSSSPSQKQSRCIPSLSTF